MTIYGVALSALLLLCAAHPVALRWSVLLCVMWLGTFAAPVLDPQMNGYALYPAIDLFGFLAMILMSRKAYAPWAGFVGLLSAFSILCHTAFWVFYARGVDVGALYDAAIGVLFAAQIATIGVYGGRQTLGTVAGIVAFVLERKRTPRVHELARGAAWQTVKL